MDALDAGNSNHRQSDLLSLINRDVKPRIVNDRAYSTTAPNMAASMISPTYSNAPPPPYSIGWRNTPPNPSAGFISPPDSRRTSDNKAEPPPPIQTQHHRQSLPSIHEALSSGPSGVKPGPYASPVSASLSHTQHQLPYSSQSAAIPRTYPGESHSYPSHLGPAQPRHPSPLQPTHAQSNPFGRPEPAPASYPESARLGPLTSLQTAPGPPPNPYAPRTPYEPSRYESESRAAGTGYTHHPPPSLQGHYQHGQSPSMPPHAQQNSVDPRYSQQGKDVNGSSDVTHFRHDLKRRLDVWGVGNDLEIIEDNCTSVQEWARHYNQIAREQQGPIPDRMPSVKSCQQQIDDTRKTLDSLERMKEILQSQEATERQRESGYKQASSDYGDEFGLDEKYPSGEFKKRRGRAAPPGRCHSCNRDETPEWRRGPDGARTLCNACGLHYAKLTRKNAMMQSQGKGSALRPKSMDNTNPPRPL